MKKTKKQIEELGNSLVPAILEYCELKNITLDEYFMALEEYTYQQQKKKEKKVKR